MVIFITLVKILPSIDLTCVKEQRMKKKTRYGTEITFDSRSVYCNAHPEVSRLADAKRFSMQ